MKQLLTEAFPRVSRGKLRKYVEGLSEEELSWTFVHFSDLNKLGLNPSAKFDTPIGIYGYPITPEAESLEGFSIEEIIKRDVPYAGDRKFMHIFKVKPEHRDKIVVLQNPFSDFPKIRQQFPELGEFMYDSVAWNIDQLQRTGDDVEQVVVDAIVQSHKTWRDEAHKNDRTSKAWNVMRHMFGKSAQKWTSGLKRYFGVHGIVDNGTGTLHKNEPAQAFFASADLLEHIMTIEDTGPNLSAYSKEALPGIRATKGAASRMQKLAKKWGVKLEKETIETGGGVRFNLTISDPKSAEQMIYLRSFIANSGEVNVILRIAVKNASRQEVYIDKLDDFEEAFNVIERISERAPTIEKFWQRGKND